MSSIPLSFQRYMYILNVFVVSHLTVLFSCEFVLFLQDTFYNITCQLLDLLTVRSIYVFVGIVESCRNYGNNC